MIDRFRENYIRIIRCLFCDYGEFKDLCVEEGRRKGKFVDSEGGIWRRPC